MKSLLTNWLRRLSQQLARRRQQSDRISRRQELSPQLRTTRLEERRVLAAPTFTSLPANAVLENQTDAIDVDAIDDVDSEGSGLTYSISGGDDAALFDIDAATGIVTFKTAPNFESPADDNKDNLYLLDVTVTDSDTESATQNIVITVLNTNEDPTINSSDTASVDENQTVAIDVDSTDPDGETEGGGLTYSITGGADEDLFDIDVDTGEVTFKAAPDFETPGDADNLNDYELEVTVTDGAGATDVQAITINVTNVNEAPSITSSATADAAENQTVAIDVNSTDPEGETEGGGLTYEITGGADEALFDIDVNTGEVTFLVAPDFETPGDDDNLNDYELEVTVTDGGTATDVQAITINVTNVNEDPTITSSATADAAENQTVAIDVNSSDPDGETEGSGLTYEITGGADEALFDIAADTGKVTFKAAPDFETPGDADNLNDYELEVTVTDGAGATDVQAITINVTNVNEDPSITSSNTANVTENQTVAIDVNSTDLDNETEGGGGLTYEITGGADEALFDIDADTGEVTFKAAPDFESPGDSNNKNDYQLQVTVTDMAGATDVQAITINVTNVNEDPSITSPATANAAELQTFAIDVDSSDLDGQTENGGGLTYAITGGDDQLLFDIDADTGEVTFKSAPSFEAPSDANTDNQYLLQVTVTDADGLTDVQDITITVTNVNEPPTIDSPATANAAENQTVAIDVQSSDPDGEMEGGGGLTYSISGGPDQTLFDIDADTGEVTFKSAPDFEAPDDSNGDNEYRFRVTVEDAAGAMDTQQITITVTNVNEPPEITSPATATVDENQVSAIDVNATDEEGETENGGGLTYAITGGADQALFDIDTGTGVVTFKSAPDLENPADANMDNDYELQVTVSDSATNTDTQDITITVANVNETPSITSATTADAPENQTFAIDVQASDLDGETENGGGLTYEITGGDDQGLFTIDPATGIVTFDSAPDFETPGDKDSGNDYELEVTVTDAGGLTDVQDITINVTNVNEPPSITSAATANAAENQTMAIDVQSSDLDGETENGGGLTYAITGGADQTLFTIDPDTGIVSFNAAPNFEAAGDAGGDNDYELQVTVTDDDGLTDVQDVTVTVTNVNEDPSITSPAAANAAENQTFAIDVQSSDLDGEFENGGGLTYTITGGADATLFKIDKDTGVVNFKTAPDFDSPGDADTDNDYELEVTVTDAGGLTDAQDITITVTNVNETPSIISSANPGAPENQTLAVDVQSSDLDGETENGGGLTYAITGGVDQGLFNIDPDTGELRFNAAPDFEAPPLDADNNNDYEVQVTVTDAGGLTDVQDITVAVTNVNEGPAITSSATPSAPENQTVAVDVQSFDIDGETENGGGLTYSITGGDDQGLFTINAKTGVVLFKAAPDLEMPDDANGDNQYQLQVTVTDAGGLSDVQDITVTVTNVNELPSIISPPTNSISENQTFALDVQSSDLDGETENGGGLTYSITGGADQADFSIDPNTGKLSFKAAPDFDIAGDADMDNVYEVRVTVTDVGGLADSQDIEITITDVNDLPPEITSGQSFTIAENTPNGTVIGNVGFTDDIDGTYEFFIDGGNDNSKLMESGAFTIMPNGDIVVTNVEALDFETMSTFTLQLRLSDGTLVSAQEEIQITLTDEVEAIVFTPPNGRVVMSLEGNMLHLRDPDAPGDTNLIAPHVATNVSSVTIIGDAAVDTTLEVGAGSVPVGGLDFIGNANDKLIVPTGPNNWTLTGPDAGTVNSDIEFTGVDILQGSGSDQLIVTGNDYDTIRHQATGPMQGQFDFDFDRINNTGTIDTTYSGFTEVEITPDSLDHLILDLPAGATTSSLNPSGGANLLFTADAGSFAPISLSPPSSSLTIRGGDGPDTVNINPAGGNLDYDGDLNIDNSLGMGPVHVTFVNDTTIGGQLSINAADVLFQAPTTVSEATINAATVADTAGITALTASDSITINSMGPIGSAANRLDLSAPTVDVATANPAADAAPIFLSLVTDNGAFVPVLNASTVASDVVVVSDGSLEVEEAIVGGDADARFVVADNLDIAEQIAAGESITIYADTLSVSSGRDDALEAMNLGIVTEGPIGSEVDPLPTDVEIFAAQTPDKIVHVANQGGFELGTINVLADGDGNMMQVSGVSNSVGRATTVTPEVTTTPLEADVTPVSAGVAEIQISLADPDAENYVATVEWPTGGQPPGNVFTDPGQDVMPSETLSAGSQPVMFDATYIANPDPDDNFADVVVTYTIDSPEGIAFFDATDPNNLILLSQRTGTFTFNILSFGVPLQRQAGDLDEDPPEDVPIAAETPPLPTTPETVPTSPTQFTPASNSQSTEVVRKFVLKIVKVKEDGTEVEHDIMEFRQAVPLKSLFSELLNDHYRLYFVEGDSKFLIKDFVLENGVERDQEILPDAGNENDTPGPDAGEPGLPTAIPPEQTTALPAEADGDRDQSLVHSAILGGALVATQDRQRDPLSRFARLLRRAKSGAKKRAASERET